MPQGISKSSDPKVCVLKCEEATHYFEFPDEDIFRNLWLYLLGLERVDHTAWVCNKHFSENMLLSSGKKLVELAVPDLNLPKSLLKINVIYDQLIKKITTRSPEREVDTAGTVLASMKSPKLTEILPDTVPTASAIAAAQDKADSILPPLTKEESLYITNTPAILTSAVTLSTTTAPVIPVQSATATLTPAATLSTTIAPVANVTSSSMPSTNATSNGTAYDWLNDSSNLLMDYQLRVQGKHMCDVIEMPEYIVVFTVLKAKEPKIIARKNLVQSMGKDNVNPLYDIPSSISAPQPVLSKDTMESGPNNEKFLDNKGLAAQIVKQPEIDYVYYMTEEVNPRREREIQVDIPNNTRELAIQCDVELDSDIVQMTYGSQLYREESHFFAAAVNMHECHICGEIAANYASIQKHASEHKKIQALCPHCGQVFSSHRKLKAHERDIHLANELEIKKAVRCPKLHCNKAFHSRKQLNSHIDQHITNAVHECNKCLRLFPSALKLHCHQNAYKNCLKWRWSKARRWKK